MGAPKNIVHNTIAQITAGYKYHVTTDLSASVNTLSTNVLTLSTNVDTLSTDLTTLTTNVDTLSTNFNSLYSLVNSHSAIWEITGAISGDYLTKSAFEAYSGVNGPKWDSVYATVHDSSAPAQLQLNSVYSTVQANSATWSLTGSAGVPIEQIWALTYNV